MSDPHKEIVRFGLQVRASDLFWCAVIAGGGFVVGAAIVTGVLVWAGRLLKLVGL